VNGPSQTPCHEKDERFQRDKGHDAIGAAAFSAFTGKSCRVLNFISR
jgi:hypothetical protein